MSIHSTVSGKGISTQAVSSSIPYLLMATSIEVIMEELSDGQFDKKTGIIKWPLQLKPGEQRDLILQYKVKYPKNRRLNIE